MNKIRALIVDDEPLAIVLLKKYVDMVAQLEVVGTSHSAIKAFNLLNEKKVDLLFLDIRMPMLNGIDFIKTLKNPPAIILTTAYREYALDGYDLDIVDYLLKPIPFERFLKAVDRYRNQNGAAHKLVSPDLPSAAKAYIILTVNRTHYKVLLSDILYIESLKDYVRVHTLSDTLVVKNNIGAFLEQLPADQFIRIHRSYAVALVHVKAYNQSEVQIARKTLPIGGSYRGVLEGKI